MNEMLLLLLRCPAGGPLRRAAPLGQSRGRLRVLLQRRHRLRARPDACATPPLPRPAFAPAVTRRPSLCLFVGEVVLLRLLLAFSPRPSNTAMR